MRDNTNPIYLQEFLTTPFYANADDFGYNTKPSDFIKNNALKLGVAAVGAGSKVIKDNRLIARIIQEFPDPMSLKQYLTTTLKNSRQAQILASKLEPNMSTSEYKSYIRNYICKTSIGRYLLHAVGGTYSLAGNAINAGVNEYMPIKDIINNSLT